MMSPLPKVLHPVAGQPMIRKVIEAVKGAGASEVRLVVGYGEKLVRQVVEPLGVRCFAQLNQWGTADAVKAAQPAELSGTVVILNGDHPLLRARDLQKIVAEFEASKSDIAVVTANLRRPGQLGRIVRHHGQLRAIVEVSDASSETLKITEVNSGIYVLKSESLNEYLPRIANHNAKNEFYLTDIVSLALEAAEKVIAIEAPSAVAFGVNTQAELAEATRVLFRRKINELMAAGVVVIAPANTFVESSVEVGAASVLYPGVYLRGDTKVGTHCVIEPNCHISHTRVGNGVHIKAGCYIDQSVIGSRCAVGPYANLRPQTELGDEAHIGNFVELKKVKFGARSKANHLTYLGDAEIGTDTNIGCGTITCNYAVDRQKYKTEIGNNVFVGSDTQFVAPVKVGDFAVIGSGSTITKDVPERALAVARAKQLVRENYVAPLEGSDSTDAAKLADASESPGSS